MEHPKSKKNAPDTVREDGTQRKPKAQDRIRLFVDLKCMLTDILFCHQFQFRRPFACGAIPLRDHLRHREEEIEKTLPLFKVRVGRHVFPSPLSTLPDITCPFLLLGAGRDALLFDARLYYP
jgi:hypothetical protein